MKLNNLHQAESYEVLAALRSVEAMELVVGMTEAALRHTGYIVPPELSATCVE